MVEVEQIGTGELEVDKIVWGGSCWGFWVLRHGISLEEEARTDTSGKTQVSVLYAVFG